MVELYYGGYSIVSKSGVGQAILHQEKILHTMNVQTTKAYQKQVQIVHINTVFPDSLIEAFKAKRRGQHIVWFAHSTKEDFRNSFPCSNLLAPLFQKWITFCYRKGDVIITPTPYSKRLLQSYGIKQPIYVLSNGVNTEYFAPDATARKEFRESIGLTEADKVVVSAGLLIERKGILDYIETAKQLPDVTFLWYGDTPKKLIKCNVRKAIKNAPSNLRFMGYVPQSELRKAYQGADAFLFLSNEETEGIVVLEALACQVPMILRDIPAYGEWLPHKEAVYKVKQADEIIPYLKSVLEDTDTAARMTENGRRIAECRNFKMSGEQLLKIYESKGWDTAPKSL